MQTKLFKLSRMQLAGWYALFMGVTLSVFGLITYEVVIRNYLYSIDQESKAVAEAWRNNIELHLKQPRRLEPSIKKILPDVCFTGTTCQTRSINEDGYGTSTKHHILSTFYQGDYYVRFVDGSGQLIAASGLQIEGLPLTTSSELKQTTKDQNGNRYYQMSLSLHTPDQQLWGYLQVGRSLKDFDNRLAALKLVFFLGLPITVLLVGSSSWWLAGLAMRPIQRSYQQMQRFTADAAHELRTPLAAILATVDSTVRTPTLTEQEARDTFKTIERQVSRFFELVKDLLLLSRLERDELASQPQLLCLNDLVNDLVEEFSALANSADLKLTAKMRTNKSLQILADEDQICRMITNIVVNAIQYTPAGGNITLILDCSDRHALIQVQDTGIGIDPQELSRIFDRFYRASSDRSRHTGGTGLGLAIAQAIAQAHHGSIRVKSELDRGSTFTIDLPLKIHESTQA